MYNRHERKVIATIGADRAAKLSYDLTRHHARLRAAMESQNISDLPNDNEAEEKRDAGTADLVGVGAVGYGSEVTSEKEMRNRGGTGARGSASA